MSESSSLQSIQLLLPAGRMSVNDRAYEVYVCWAKEKEQQMKEQAARAIQAVIPKWLERTKEKKRLCLLQVAILQRLVDDMGEQIELNRESHERSARSHERTARCLERSARSHERTARCLERSARSHQLTNQLLEKFERKERRRKQQLAKHHTDKDISAPRFSQCYAFDDPLGKTGGNIIGVEMDDALMQFKNFRIEDENASDEEPEFEHDDDVPVMDLFVGIHCDH